MPYSSRWLLIHRSIFWACCKQLFCSSKRWLFSKTAQYGAKFCLWLCLWMLVSAMQSFCSIYYLVSMHVYYTCHCTDLSHPLFLFHLACAENILRVWVPCQSNRGKSLFLGLDLPSFPLVFLFVSFSSEALFRCMQLLGVQFNIFCVVLQASFSLGESDMVRTQ